MYLVQAKQDNSVSAHSPPVFLHFKAPRLAAFKPAQTVGINLGTENIISFFRQ